MKANIQVSVVISSATVALAGILVYTWFRVSGKEKKDSVSSLCTGRFYALAPYFQNLIISDLYDSTESEIIECVPDEKRLLAHAFYKEKLQKLLAVEFSPRKNITVTKQEDGSVLIDGGLTFGPKNVCSSRYKLPTCYHVTDIEKLFPDECKTLSWLQISNCNLHDEDLDGVADLVSKNMPNCRVVNLSWNRLHGIAPALKNILDNSIARILKLPNIEFLDMTYNPFASIDRTDFLDDPSVCDDQKLIWIPQDFLESKNGNDPSWYGIITDTNRRKVILETHRKYYRKEWMQ
jgi:hypothetical protein